MIDGATANSSPRTAAGHNRMTRSSRRSPLRRAACGFWIRAWGQREAALQGIGHLSSPAQSDLAAQGWTGHPRHSCTLEIVLNRTPAPDVDALCLVTRSASRNTAYGPIASPLLKGRQTWFISESNKILATVPSPAGMIDRSLRPRIRVQHEGPAS